ncbi:hypothetical protein ACP_1603 [Acidobacterium capsulatum ATCC 51196]|uniref:Uncharacterized protein n=1 Tax=Acidobacterium capsulatum (strain ATCC 51196 / DSM 11244 / BCRC 80197 / JCM 7670 / NBRC 15755 / NCIMB 13165 / 161) TaxID=240015 RepID=C1F749_ACIC5|nr:hypothetical protein ACP_1603 [Acidobacterium capsulatum ATCC 51196]
MRAVQRQRSIKERPQRFAARHRTAWLKMLSQEERRRMESDSASAPQLAQTAAELREERRKLRRLQLMMDMVMSVIGQSPHLSIDEAAEMIAQSERAALAMFPDKELAFRLLYKPRLQRLMRERYRIQ